MTKPPLRPDLESLSAYLAPQLEAPVRLNTNECPFPPPEAFSRDLAEATARIPFHRYPDREATALRKGLAELTGHPVEGVWAANGSNEVIQHLCLAYGGPGRAALVFEPTYSLHKLIPRMVGMEIVDGRLGEGFRIDERAVEAVSEHRPSIIFVCSPNNPTGNAQPADLVAPLCEAAEGLVIVDEAYGEFGGETAYPLIQEHENLVVVRTFSKAFSLAAVRLGYALASPSVVEDMAKVRLPYHLSALTQAAGEVALRHVSAARDLLERIREQRDRILRELGGIEGVEVFPSDSNFVLLRTPVEAPVLWQALLDRGVLVRDVSAYPGLERCLRVTAGTPEETGAFLAALPEALEEVA
ncbi:MAG TPA: histidinol-phosphate transaminase [Actinomycetota bacterium]|nr:histidinol-phosphate transaminase [Actinomycetota bacterium]